MQRARNLQHDARPQLAAGDVGVGEHDDLDASPRRRRQRLHYVGGHDVVAALRVVRALQKHDAVFRAHGRANRARVVRALHRDRRVQRRSFLKRFSRVDGSAAHASFEDGRFRVRFGFRFPRRFSARVSQQLVRGASSRRSRVRAAGLRLHGRLRTKRRDAGAGDPGRRL